MTVTASTLRQNIYKLLDKVLETGEPLEITRKGKILQVVPKKQTDKKQIEKLKKRDIIKGDPDSLVHLDWSDEWKI